MLNIYRLQESEIYLHSKGTQYEVEAMVVIIEGL